MEKTDIKDFTLRELERAIGDLGEPRYRARQVFSWVYKRGARSFGEMENLPASLMGKLGQAYRIGSVEEEERTRSSDGTEKFLFRLPDNNFIETVLIRSQARKTLCLSTQVGCRFACPFCASGSMGFTRNLAASEILEQVLFLRDKTRQKITNFVFMGMGEPLDNYENTSRAIIIMNDKEALGIGARRITVSTCGIIPGIDKLKDMGLQVNLSISLHAANDRLRDKLVPVNKRYPLEDLVAACERYIEKAGRAITLEYVLIKGENDSGGDADGLAEIARRLKAKVNIILCSAVAGGNFKAPSKKETELFINQLLSQKVNATLRKSKGQDIRAACGQLAGKKNA